MLSLANMLDLFTNEFARLKREQQAGMILPDAARNSLQRHVRLSLQQCGIRHCEAVAIQHYAALQENGAQAKRKRPRRERPLAVPRSVG